MKTFYTIEAQLKIFKQEDEDLLGQAMKDFGHMQRVTWQKIKMQAEANDLDTEFKNFLAAEIKADFNLTSRTAYSVVGNMLGRYSALNELKQTELTDKRQKIEALQESIEELQKKLNELKPKIASNSADADEKKDYQNWKTSVAWKKMKINKIQQQTTELEKQQESGDLKICFGTKDLFRKNLEDFRDQRDSELYFIGRAGDTACNQNLQLSFNHKLNQFQVKVRVENLPVKYLYFQCYFGLKQQKELKNILATQSTALTYRIKKRYGNYYLQAIFKKDFKSTDAVTSFKNGAIAVDFNQGFCAVVETDQHGNLVNQCRFDYRFSAGNATTVDLQVIAKKLMELCLKTGKSLVIENLDFKKKKSDQVKGYKKIGNKNLSSLPYAEFAAAVLQRSVRDKVFVKKVNPWNTSKIGEQKFVTSMKLNSHFAAALVIARKGQGFKDVLLKEKKK